MTDIDELGRLAARSGTVIGVAESLTAGNLSARIGAAEGAGEWFAGGVTAYRVATKVRALGVSEGIDPCSGACAEQMAVGARAVLGADLVASVTGVGGPDEQDGHAPGTVYLGWADAEGAGHVLLQYGGEPEEVIEACVQSAIDLLASRLGR